MVAERPFHFVSPPGKKCPNCNLNVETKGLEVDGKAIPEVTLNDGTTLPVTGLGTYRLWGNAGANAVSSGINAGYRLIDTAYNYETEGAVGGRH